MNSVVEKMLTQLFCCCSSAVEKIETNSLQLNSCDKSTSSDNADLISDSVLSLEFERILGPPKKVGIIEYTRLQMFKLGEQNDAYACYTLCDLNEDLRFYTILKPRAK
jgi:hypothetical protein